MSDAADAGAPWITSGAVYASDPATFQWHIYTEGWSRGAPVRYDDAGINQFAAPWLVNMPGWQEVGYWQYENEQLDDLGKKLYRGEFTSHDDRDSLYQQVAIIKSIDDSRYLWPHLLEEISNALPQYTWLTIVTQTSAPPSSAVQDTTGRVAASAPLATLHGGRAGRQGNDDRRTRPDRSPDRKGRACVRHAGGRGRAARWS